MERIAVLLYHQNGLPFGQRNNADTTAVVYHVPLYNFSVLQFRSVFGDMENFCLINQITAFVISFKCICHLPFYWIQWI